MEYRVGDLLEVCYSQYKFRKIGEVYKVVNKSGKQYHYVRVKGVEGSDPLDELGGGSEEYMNQIFRLFEEDEVIL